uniref:CSON010820 protein n=1 Tax=Culicoides sonorensis TaxID=179676 RepID=A0A336M517_CULSO
MKLKLLHGQILPEYLPGIPAFDVQSSGIENTTKHELVTRCRPDLRLDCDGCHRQIVCDYDGNILSRVNCPTTLPYCSAKTGQCISTPSNECLPMISSITMKKSDLCPSTGFFPDPLNCNKFNYCTNEMKAIPYVCPYYYVYDPVSHLCRLHKSSEDCPIINCNQFPNRFVSYPLDRTLFTFCNMDINGNIRALLYQCTSETIFNPIKEHCEFVCGAGEGRFEYPSDKSKFYLCVMSSFGEIVPFVMSCDDGSRFEDGKCTINERNLTEVITEVPVSTTTMGHAIAFVPIKVPLTQNASNVTQ